MEQSSRWVGVVQKQRIDVVPWSEVTEAPTALIYIHLPTAYFRSLPFTLHALSWTTRLSAAMSTEKSKRKERKSEKSAALDAVEPNKKHKKSKERSSQEGAVDEVDVKDAKETRKKNKREAAGEQQDEEAGRSADSLPKKEKKKKPKTEGREDGRGETDIATAIKTKKKKPKTDNEDQAEALQAEDEVWVEDAAHETEKKRKVKSRVKQDAPHLDEGDSKEKDRKRRKEKKEELDEVARVDGTSSQMGDTGSAEKKRTKRKKKDAGEDNADAGVEDGERPKKRKARRKPEYPDPADDESLSEGAAKGDGLYACASTLTLTLPSSALAYASARFADPSSWKFNKARQNWIIRNVWSENAVCTPPMNISFARRII